MVRSRVRARAFALVSGVLAGVLVALCVGAAPASAAGSDAFYTYRGKVPLARYAPGAILKSRTLPLHVVGVPTPIKVVQLLYRSTSQLGAPTANVTSVLLPPSRPAQPKLVAYQSFYDSLSPDDSPSRAIAGGQLTLGGLIPQLESGLVAPLLLSGYTVTIADTEGQAADFAAGPEYGMNTLDGIRATLRNRTVGLPAKTPIGLIGYSGGAIASEWAAELAPTYAPEVSRHIVGTAAGGVLVDPAHNLHYVDGSSIWAGVVPMAVIGAARAFKIDLTPYLSSYGLEIFAKLKNATIVQVLAQYPGLTWAKLAKPQYATPETVPTYVSAVNHLIMGTGGTPTAPIFLGQGTGGTLEGTSGSTPGIGAGDGVMIAGDVRTLARTYCARGATVQYQQYDGLSHTLSALPFIAQSVPWLLDRFAGKPAPQNCGSIAPGNPLTPVTAP